MSRLEIILSAILLISMMFNVGIFIYARATITRLLYVSEELGDLQQMTNAFSNHLRAVYELDTFYGDQTLSALLEHAVSFNKQLETFDIIYSITEEEEGTNDDTANTQEAPSETQHE